MPRIQQGLDLFVASLMLLAATLMLFVARVLPLALLRNGAGVLAAVVCVVAVRHLIVAKVRARAAIRR